MIRRILFFFNESIVFLAKEINYIPKYRLLKETKELNTWQSGDKKALNLSYK